MAERVAADQARKAVQITQHVPTRPIILFVRVHAAMAAGILHHLVVNAAMATGLMLRHIAGQAAHIVLRQDRAARQMDHVLSQRQQRHAV